MRVVVALDSFKGGLSAAEACRVVGEGLREASPETDVVTLPMADGGEGTVTALLNSRDEGQWVGRSVAGPLRKRTVNAGFGWFPGDGTAVVEMARANGLPLLSQRERDPMAASTYGTGQLLEAAVEYGAERILMGIGGSATVDGGVGAASAWGWEFIDKNRRPVTPAGGHLSEIRHCIPPDNSRIPPVTVLCDVSNPLYGPRGAARVYAPQKGANPGEVAILEAGLVNLARCVEKDLNLRIQDVPGAGAAGGLGAGAVAFFGAELKPGVSAIIRETGLEQVLEGADWCVTGEGSFDRQSLDGKVVSGVVRAAQRKNVPVVVLAGQVDIEADRYEAHGVQTARAIHDPAMPVEEAIRREKELLRRSAVAWVKSVSGST
ncbi:MAG: glycerate kinase [Planctomycetota bacterium]